MVRQSNVVLSARIQACAVLLGAVVTAAATVAVSVYSTSSQNNKQISKEEADKKQDAAGVVYAATWTLARNMPSASCRDSFAEAFPATEVGSATATLSGVVKAHPIQGEPQSGWIEINVGEGRVIRYASRAGAGPVRGEVGALSCGSTYFYQAVWVAGPVVVNSDAKSFTTLSCPPT